MADQLALGQPRVKKLKLGSPNLISNNTNNDFNIDWRSLDVELPDELLEPNAAGACHSDVGGTLQQQGCATATNALNGSVAACNGPTAVVGPPPSTSDSSGDSFNMPSAVTGLSETVTTCSSSYVSNGLPMSTVSGGGGNSLTVAGNASSLMNAAGVARSPNIRGGAPNNFQEQQAQGAFSSSGAYMNSSAGAPMPPQYSTLNSQRMPMQAPRPPGSSMLNGHQLNAPGPNAQNGIRMNKNSGFTNVVQSTPGNPPPMVGNIVPPSHMQQMASPNQMIANQQVNPNPVRMAPGPMGHVPSSHYQDQHYISSQMIGNVNSARNHTPDYTFPQQQQQQHGVMPPYNAGINYVSQRNQFAGPVPNSSSPLLASLGDAVTTVAASVQQQQLPMGLNSNAGGIMTSGNIMPTQGNSNGSNTAQDPEKRKLIQQQLVLLLHAHKCQQRERDPSGQRSQCSLPHCQTMKNVLNHMTGCTEGRACQDGFPDSPVVRGVVSPSYRYAAPMAASQTSPSFGPSFPPLENASVPKEWHKLVTSDLRQHLVTKLVKAIFPSPDPAAIHDQRIKDLIQYARKVEKEMFDVAEDREEYYHLLAEKIYKIQKELQEKKQKRLEMARAQTVASSQPSAPLTPWDSANPPNRVAPVDSLRSVSPSNSSHHFSNATSLGSNATLSVKNESISVKGEDCTTYDSISVGSVKVEAGPHIKNEPADGQTASVTESVKMENVKMENVKLEKGNLEIMKSNPEKVFTQDELVRALLPVWERIDRMEEAIPFRVPVDPQLLNIPDYFDIVKKPMDLLTIKENLLGGEYKKPWDFCDHLSEVFVEEIDPVMRMLGYCCGRKLSFTPLALVCYGQPMCAIPRDAHYYCYEPKFVVENGIRFVHCTMIRFIPAGLPHCKLSMHVENRVNKFLRKSNSCAGEVIIRVLASSDKEVEVKPLMKTKFCTIGEIPEKFPYRTKAIFAYEVVDGVEICFFGLHVQEYGSNCPQPNSRRVYIAYLDSVHFFQPKHIRTAVYHEILLGYLEYVKVLGYTMAHIWACPPSEGDDYIFHCHPAEQRIPKPKRLQEWYKKMLDKGIVERIVVDYKDIYKHAQDEHLQSATELPYFEGDYWPNVLEDCIKELDAEEAERRRELEAQAAADAAGDDVEDLIDEVHIHEKKKSMKIQKKKSQKNKNSQSKKSKKIISGTGNELSDKIYTMMEKHKEVFFVVRLHSAQAAAVLAPVNDPDALITCELMDGRDSFLSIARERHWEFSSLRRAKFSTMALCYELHTQGQDKFVYTCNGCKGTNAMWHCTICDVSFSLMCILLGVGIVEAEVILKFLSQDFDLCQACYEKSNHEHKMEQIKSIISDDNSNSGESGASSANSRNESIQRCMQSLVHACQCRDANCRRLSCHKMKRVVQHTKVCKKRQVGHCPVCKQLVALCCFHARTCSEPNCSVPFCQNIRQKLNEQQLQLRKRAQREMQRRMNMMQHQSMPVATTGPPMYHHHHQSAAPSQPSPSVPAVGGQPPSAPPAAVRAAMEVERIAASQSYARHPNVQMPRQMVAPGANAMATRHVMPASTMGAGSGGCWGDPGVPPKMVGMRGPPPSQVHRHPATAQQDAAGSFQPGGDGMMNPSMQMAMPPRMPYADGRVQMLLQRLKTSNKAEFESLTRELNNDPQLLATVINMRHQQIGSAPQVTPNMVPSPRAQWNVSSQVAGNYGVSSPGMPPPSGQGQMQQRPQFYPSTGANSGGGGSAGPQRMPHPSPAQLGPPSYVSQQQQHDQQRRMGPAPGQYQSGQQAAALGRGYVGSEQQPQAAYGSSQLPRYQIPVQGEMFFNNINQYAKNAEIEAEILKSHIQIIVHGTTVVNRIGILILTVVWLCFVLCYTIRLYWIV
ncbi:putative bromodomain protein [Trichinella spiralis]|uniref:putative bromodomain protein n=1 Tax=Trichinella spiralis TaxID=6334 RepID=UPI0001EFBE4C|nr:putative bromodomain protein [Trichinella spiralis]